MHLVCVGLQKCLNYRPQTIPIIFEGFDSKMLHNAAVFENNCYLQFIKKNLKNIDSVSENEQFYN